MIKLFMTRKCQNIFFIRQKVKHRITLIDSLIYFGRFPSWRIIIIWIFDFYLLFQLVLVKSQQHNALK